MVEQAAAVESPSPVVRHLPSAEHVGYIRTGRRCHIDINLDVRVSQALNNLAAGLDRDQARTGDGRRVTNGPTAIRWLLDRLADEKLVILD